MQVLRNLFCLLFLSLPFFLNAQIEDAKGIFRELRTMDGVWFMSTDRGDRLEIWKKTNDTTIVGRVIRIKPENGDTVSLENIRLERSGDKITYNVQIKNQNNNQFVPFALTTADADGYVFENPQNEDIQKIHYRLLGNREMQVTTEGKRGNRPVTTEYVFEREFAPGAVEFRLRGGINAHTLKGTGNLKAVTNSGPDFAWKPGWELGTQISFKGAGGFITINLEVGLTGRYSHVNTFFTRVSSSGTSLDTTLRNLTYGSTWLDLAVVPQITLKRDGKLSIIFGPYLGTLLGNIPHGTSLPVSDNKLYKANNDFKKTELGMVAGFQYKLNFGKKDLGGMLGLRANIGLSNIDNLYSRGITSTAFANGQVKFTGVSLYYSINLVKL
jgi:hypothetical protein